MIGVIVLFAALIIHVVGLIIGYTIGQSRTKAALQLARYNDAIALADDLVKTPDATDLRPRAQKLLADHRKANNLAEEH